MSDRNVTDITDFGGGDDDFVVLESVSISREVCDYIAAKGDALFHKIFLIVILLTMIALGSIETASDRWLWVLGVAAALNYWSYYRANRHARNLYKELG